MTARTKLAIAWDVDRPSLGFTDRVLARALESDEADEGARTSRILRKPLAASPSSGADHRRQWPLAVALAAAATVVLYLGVPPGQSCSPQHFQANEPDRLELQTQLGQDALARSLTNGGNSGMNPEAGTTGLW
jgi:hypothetical protein